MMRYKSKIWTFFDKKRKGSLEKSELYKPTSNTAVDLQEIKTGSSIVPKFLIAFLVRELSPLKVGDTKTIDLNFLREGATLHLIKRGEDVYDGEIIEKGRIVAKIEKRTIPGIGLHLLSSFELYDVQSQQQPAPAQPVNVITHTPTIQPPQPVQPIVVNVNIQNEQKGDEQKEKPSENSAKSLKEFLEKRNLNKHYKVVGPIDLKKSGNVDVMCDVCGKNIFSVYSGYNGCVCMGENMRSPIKLTKSEDGKVYLYFPKQWKEDNVKLFIQMLYRKLLKR